MRALTHIAEIAGAGLVAYGAWLTYAPAGFLVGGALLITGAALASRSDGK
jgi:hypothetical protein